MFMRKIFCIHRDTLLLCIAVFTLLPGYTQQGNNVSSKMDWWRKARFGMFIHWGVYAVPAGIYNGKNIDGLGEWIMQDAHIPRSEYAKYAQQFNPTKYDAEAWVKMAKQAGMKYIVITAKHHDGFAMFNTKASNWNITDATPYGKDVIKPLAEACRKFNIKLGLYYSQANDWYNPGGAAAFGHWDSTQTTKTMDEYIDDVAIKQVKEILSNYGDIAELWWDVPTGMNNERAAKLNALLALQPNIITNNRLGGDYKGDIETPEQYIPSTGIEGRDWETCMTMNDTWGFKKNDNNWKSSATLIQNLIDIASKGGNYLLNVGPTDKGEFPQPIVERLNAIGNWMNINSEAIYATTASPFKVLPWGRCTKKTEAGKTILYLHVFSWPNDGKLLVPGLKNKIASAYILGTEKTLATTASDDGAIIQLPATAPDKIATVIKVEINEQLNIQPFIVHASADGSIMLPADMADLHNVKDEANMQVEGDDNARNIGYWTSDKPWISWDINFPSTGNYTIEATTATTADESHFTINTNNENIQCTVKGTGDYQSYTTTAIGTINITQTGKQTISIHPSNGWNAINLRSVKLIPKHN
jgi:alpha-L-fucosidase